MARAFKQRNRLGQALVFYRAAKAVDLRAVAKEIGISSATLSRVERGYSPDAYTLILIWQWFIAAEEK
jgi:transcriptional regulator with XRE-family HTH domain